METPRTAVPSTGAAVAVSGVAVVPVGSGGAWLARHGGRGYAHWNPETLAFLHFAMQPGA